MDDTELLDRARTAVDRSYAPYSEYLAVSSAERDGVTPCGMCRQSLVEFCEAALRVVCEGDDSPTVYTLGELLPEAIGPEALE
ncbi:hypothetical protein BRC63_05240 [Halobacteriales archaeon QH_10_70_21]|nr:MAG: hypothetical protein BRC63_05240 [Halobacteriales archaeon QH_10_70_21]